MNWQQDFVKNPKQIGSSFQRQKRVSLGAVAVLLALVVGCKMEIERGAKASHGEDAASSATGEYKDIRVGKIERGDVEVDARRVSRHELLLDHLVRVGVSIGVRIRVRSWG